jgi:nitrogen fixation protein FixH
VASYLKQEDKEHRLGWKVTFSGLDAVHVGVPAEVLAVAVDGKGQPLAAAQVSLQLKRVAVAGDTHEYDFTAIRDGQYRLQLTLAAPGLWDARVIVRHGNDKYELQRILDVRQSG